MRCHATIIGYWCLAFAFVFWYPIQSISTLAPNYRASGEEKEVMCRVTGWVLAAAQYDDAFQHHPAKFREQQALW